ncbi:MAG: MerR family DNA-binding protein [Gammaproteobacteria bacterium]|nr:MerR family DNA-binding protein [Gammaproteobacteria bacterium]MBU6509055.1 MerR family DNA-binding protein [Gammaproteobacteria bacterium]MDE1984401.1 MerR family DNA-binding protein [Gammaproteobacteria bacterium]MDE2108747.1 MerR family DNA-binding protein [Gammaproteobacteria bacterium]MDE2460018.1 MerR family DNA-binding protein [Gammaproteobacteria bacterium]
MNELTIGGLAKAAGVGVETVRYYQRRGLMSEPLRGYSGIRRYGLGDVDRLRFIRAAQDLGFSLKEIEELLSLEQGGSCRAVERLAEGKLVLVRERIAGLKRIERTLTMLVRRCETTQGRMRCPIIQSLHGGD